MRLIVKHIKVLAMRPDEIAAMLDMVKEAQTGTTVHYAERHMDDGSYFGISVDKDNYTEPKTPAERFAKGVQNKY